MTTTTKPTTALDALFDLPDVLHTIVEVHLKDGSTEVPAYTCDDFLGLAVTYLPFTAAGMSATTSEAGTGFGWSITHVESGLRIPTKGFRLETNLLVAVALGKATDWFLVHRGVNNSVYHEDGDDFRAATHTVEGYNRQLCEILEPDFDWSDDDVELDDWPSDDVS